MLVAKRNKTEHLFSIIIHKYAGQVITEGVTNISIITFHSVLNWSFGTEDERRDVSFVRERRTTYRDTL